MGKAANNLSQSLTQVNHLLKLNQYDEIDTLFEKVQQHIGRMEHPDLWSETISAAREISRACRIVHDEVEHYQYAADEAERRESELKHSLAIIVYLITQDSRTLEEQPGLSPAIREIDLSLWQRLVSLFGQLTSSSSNFAKQPSHTNLRLIDPWSKASYTETPESTEFHATLDFHCLGYFHVYLKGQLVDIGANRRAKSVLKYLALHHAQPVLKEILMDCFWPDADPDAARNNLNVAIYNLRQALRRVEDDISYILFQDNAYLLNPAVDCWFDFEAFTEHCEKAERFDAARDTAQAIYEYKQAEALYTGVLFEEDRYEDWPATQRRYLQDSYLRALDRLSQHAFDENAYKECIGVCRQMLTIDSCREDAHMRIMQCHSRQGQQHLALRQYQRCVEVLKKELDLRPSTEITALYQRIRMNAVG